MTLRTCAGCGGLKLEACHDLSAWGSVTSDCRPWPHPVRTTLCGGCGLLHKSVDAAFRAQVQKIYDGYSMYELSDGREQLVFSELGSASTRSAAILLHVERKVEFPPAGRMLDIGCGNGAMLAVFGARKTGWALAGLERDHRCREHILTLPGVREFHTPPLDAVADRYDVITMIHVLEHFERPIEILQEVRRRLQPGGVLVIEVPNLLQNPFDVLILDHYVHFTVRSLTALLGRAGFEVVDVAADVVPKELTFIARAGEGRATPPTTVPPDELAKIVDYGHWLTTVAETVRREAGASRFGIFGTAVAGTWCGAVGGEGVQFFVDEDPERVGKKHMTRPVLHPGELGEQDRVFLAFPSPLADRLAARLRSRSAATYLVPAGDGETI